MDIPRFCVRCAEPVTVHQMSKAECERENKRYEWWYTCRRCKHQLQACVLIAEADRKKESKT